MDTVMRDRFIELWNTYFPGASLPMAFYYADEPTGLEPAAPAGKHRCFLAQLAPVRKGESRSFDVDSLGCGGGRRYLGFTQEAVPNLPEFLSCGIPGQLEGERYKKSPEIVRAMLEKAPGFTAPASYIVFKRWDRLEAGDEPEVVMFEAVPDVLSGLFTLAGFDESDIHAVMTPFCAGCGSIVQYPYLEQQSEHPRAVLGMFDVSARPWVNKKTLSFAVPMKKFVRMIANMEESFLITPSWARVKARLGD